MILLSDHAIKQREGGQSLIGGLDVEVCRNYFGSQVRNSYLLRLSYILMMDRFIVVR